MAVRVQRRRTKGWKMPAGAVYVGRGTVWGNPFIEGEPCGVFPEGAGLRGQAETLIPSLSREQVIEFYRDLVHGFVHPEMYPVGHRWFEAFRAKMHGHPMEMLYLLRGKDLACWCGPEEACHASVLLDLSTPEAERG